MHQNDEKITVRVDQIKQQVEEDLKNSQELTKTSLEENIVSIDDKLKGEMTEIGFKIKSLEVKIEQNFEKNIESSNNLTETVEEVIKSQSENLLSFKSEIFMKIDETDHHNRSLIANTEERLTNDIEKKITELGKKVFHEKSVFTKFCFIHKPFVVFF